MKKNTLFYFILLAVFVFTSVYYIGVQHGRSGNELNVINEAVAASKDKPLISPTEARERDFYAPNSEDLAPD